eukprot:symbB.v1.2.022683.t1/scaffold2025.1/size93651/6
MAVTSCKRWREGRMWMEEMKRQAVEADVITCNSMSGHWNGNMLMMQDMKQKGIQSDLVTSTNILMTSPPWPFSLQSLAILEGQQTDIIFFNAAIASLTSRWPFAGVLFECLQQEWLKVDGITCSSMTSSLGRNSQWQSAMIFHSKALGHVDSKNCNSMLNAFEKSSEWPSALNIFARQAMARTAADIISWNSVIGACQTAQQWEFCFIFFEALGSQRVVDLVTFGSVMSACEVASRWQESLFLD